MLLVNSIWISMCWLWMSSLSTHWSQICNPLLRSVFLQPTKSNSSADDTPINTSDCVNSLVDTSMPSTPKPKPTDNHINDSTPPSTQSMSSLNHYSIRDSSQTSQPQSSQDEEDSAKENFDRDNGHSSGPGTDSTTPKSAKKKGIWYRSLDFDYSLNLWYVLLFCCLSPNYIHRNLLEVKRSGPGFCFTFKRFSHSRGFKIQIIAPLFTSLIGLNFVWLLKFIYSPRI